MKFSEKLSQILFKTITTRRLKLAGHIIRMEDNRCAKTALRSCGFN